MLRIWGRATSSNVQKVMWTVGELDLEHRRVDVGGAYGGLDTPEFGALTPHRLIPVLEDGGTVIWESNAIVRYLTARYGAGGLWPDDPAERSQADMWAEWVHNAVQRPWIALFWGVVRTRKADQNPDENAANLARTVAAFEVAETRLGSYEYMSGERLGLADIQLGHMLYRWYEMEVDRPDLPNLAAYYERLKARPAYAEHVLVSFESLRPS